MDLNVFKLKTNDYEDVNAVSKSHICLFEMIEHLENYKMFLRVPREDFIKKNK